MTLDEHELALDTRQEPCWRCRGDGHYWRVPDGFNPFYAGAMMTAQVSEKIRCLECDTSRTEPKP